MKKFLSVLFLVTLCVVGFSKTTIVHWMHHSPARLEFVDKMAKQFMEENPDAMANRILYHPANLIMYHIERRSSFLSLFI